MSHQLLLDVLEALEDSDNIAIIILPYGNEYENKEEKEKKEETPYDEFRAAEIYETGAGVEQDAILMDNPLQS